MIELAVFLKILPSFELCSFSYFFFGLKILFILLARRQEKSNQNFESEIYIPGPGIFFLDDVVFLVLWFCCDAVREVSLFQKKEEEVLNLPPPVELILH